MRSNSLEEKKSNTAEESDKDSNKTVSTVNNEVLYKKKAEHQSKECAIENKKLSKSSRTPTVCGDKPSLELLLGNLAKLSAELANLNKVIEELRNLTAAAEEKTRKQLEV